MSNLPLICLCIFLGLVQLMLFEPKHKLQVATYVRVSDSASWRPVTVHDLSEYSKECYADSTAHKGFWFWRTSITGKDDIAPANDPDAWWRDWDSMGGSLERWYKTKATYRYTHREPTFPGFIQYMKGKR